MGSVGMGGAFDGCACAFVRAGDKDEGGVVVEGEVPLGMMCWFRQAFFEKWIRMLLHIAQAFCT